MSCRVKRAICVVAAPVVARVGPQEQPLALAPALWTPSRARAPAGPYGLPGDETGQERRQIDGTVGVVLRRSLVELPGELPQLPVDLDVVEAAVRPLQPHDLAPPHTGVGGQEDQDEVVLPPSQQPAPLGEQQHLQRRGPDLLGPPSAMPPPSTPPPPPLAPSCRLALQPSPWDGQRLSREFADLAETLHSE